VGVMPARFGFPGREEAWIPLAPRLHDAPRASRNVNVFARLAPGVSWAAAGEEMSGFAARLARAYPDSHAGWDLAPQPVRNVFVSPRVRRMVIIMMGAVAFVLLIACANVANLLLARATGRQREIAVRAAFGAPRRRIVAQLLTESVLLSLGGGLLGLAFAAWGIRAITSAIPDSEALPYWIVFALDGRVLAFTAAAAILTGLLFGLAPAREAARGELHGVLKEGGRGAGGSAVRNRLRGALVIAEIALALVLLIGASLFVRSLVKLERDDGGFDPRPLLTLRVFLPGSRYDDEEARVRRIDDLVRRLEALPGVEAATASIDIPLSGGGSVDPVLIDGQSFPRGEEPRIFWAGASPGFARTLGLRLERGRFLAPAEGFARRPVAVVNHTFAVRFFRGGDPLGHRFRFVGVDKLEEWLTIVGVVADFKNDDLDDDIPAAAYLPVPFYASRNQGLIVRSRLPAARLSRPVREAIHASDPLLPVFDLRTMEKVRQLGFWEFRLLSGIFGTFGFLALALAAVGIYGVLSYSVGQRVREIGIRVALGARRRAVLGLIVRQGLALAGIGIALGFAGSLAVTRVLRSYLYEVSPTDPASFAGLSLFLVGVAALASYVPARRATAVDPLDALRAE
jgi:predicted permease